MNCGVQIRSLIYGELSGEDIIHSGLFIMGKAMPHAHKLPSLLLPWHEKFTISGHDPDSMKYTNINNNKTANINVQQKVKHEQYT